MVYFHSSISVCNSIDQTPAQIMANSIKPSDSHPRSRNSRKPQTSPNSSCPEFSRSDAVDVVILISVVTACVFLFFPCIKFVAVESAQLLVELACLAKGEILRNPIVYGSMALSITCAAASAWVVMLLCTSARCRNPNCRGLKKAAEFDIQLETEDCVKSSNRSGKNKRGLFEVPRDHHRELEAELKRMAPPNGRAVLVLRASCGCSVGILEVPGPKKQRKIKK